MTARVVVLATGGTIAGQAASAADNLGYRAAALGVEKLLAHLPVPPGIGIEAEQVARLDSKDMDAATWRHLAHRIQAHLARADVRGIVVTHGTDTLEETAWFLQRTLAPRRPVVLTAAMRPATSLQADGPQNLADALVVAADGRLAGVVAALAGQVWPARGLRKLHPYRIEAFAAGDGGALASVREGRLLRWHEPPVAEPARPELLDWPVERWPRVALVASHAGVDADLLRCVVDAGYQGIVVVGTGHATVHAALEGALDAARSQGVAVWIASRCTASDGVGSLPGAPDAGWFTPVQARVELMVRLAAGAQPP